MAKFLFVLSRDDNQAATRCFQFAQIAPAAERNYAWRKIMEAEIINARNALLEMSEEIFAAPKSFVISEKRKGIEKMLKII